MSEGLKPGLAALTAILPADKASAASTALITAFRSEEEPLSSDVIWADFENDGAFVRGGASNIDGGATRRYSAPDSVAPLAALTAAFPVNRTSAGHAVISDNGDWIHWFTPNTIDALARKLTNGFRGFAIHFNLFSEVIAMFSSDARLTAAEIRTLFHLVGGLTLAESADRDGVVLETKRTHAKRCGAKLGCRGQAQMTRLAVGQLAHLISATTGEAASAEVAEWFARTYLPDDALLEVVRLGGGRTMRYFDSGPKRGRPVIFNYAIPFPVSLVNIRRYLHAHNLRVFTPIRVGYLEPDVFSEASAGAVDISHGDDDLTELIARLCDTPVPIISSSTSTVRTIRLIDRNPELFSHLFCLSPVLGATESNIPQDLGSLYNAIRDTVASGGSIAKLSWIMRGFNTSETSVRDVMLGIYGDNRLDRAALEQAANGRPVFRLLADAYKHSFIGVTEDFSRGVEPWEAAYRGLSIPIHILHGEDDHAVSAALVGHLAGLNARTQVHSIAPGGHFITSNPEEAEKTWSHIASRISR